MSEKKRSQTGMAIGVVLLGFALLTGVTSLTGSNTASLVGEALGLTMVLVLISTLLLAVTPLRKKVEISMLAAVVWFGSAGYGAFDAYDQSLRDKQFASQTIEMLEKVSYSEAITPSGKASADSKTLSELMNDYVGQTQAVFFAYTEEVNAAGIAEMLAPESLADTQKTRESLAKVDRLALSIPKYQRQLLALQLGFEKDLTARANSDAMFREALTGYNTTKQKGIEYVKRYFSIQTDTVDVMRDMLLHAQRLGGQLTTQNGYLILPDQAETDKYNALFTKLSVLSVQEEALLREQAERNSAAVDKLSHYQ